MPTLKAILFLNIFSGQKYNFFVLPCWNAPLEFAIKVVPLPP